MNSTDITATPKVAVAMSVYNGSSHLQEQIDSILNQVGVAVYLFARDDGSTDESLDVLTRYEARGSLELLRGGNVGVVRSFLSLIAAIDTSFDYIALCDQDDVWRNDKLARAVSLLVDKDQSIPQLYCSEYIFCDANMNEVAPSHLNQNGVNFTKLLYENVVSGNTIVMNRSLANAVINAGMDDVYCHDWWIALVAAALGELTYDEYPSLYYRRTGANVSPTGNSGISLLKYRLKTFFQGRQLSCITHQLEKLDSVFGSAISSNKSDVLNSFLHGRRIHKACYPQRLRQKMSEEIALRLLFLIGLL